MAAAGSKAPFFRLLDEWQKKMADCVNSLPLRGIMAAKRPRYRLFQLALFLAPNGLAEKEGELYHFAAASWYNS